MVRKEKIELRPPPPRKGNGGGRKADRDYLRAAAELRDAPGQWGVLPNRFPSSHAAAQVAHSINSGKIVAFSTPDEEWEAVSRTENDVARVFVRFVGRS